MRTAIAAILLLAGTSLGGCANPCDDLADLTCKENGATSEVCLKMQKEAERSGPQTQRSCSMALDLLKTIDETK